MPAVATFDKRKSPNFRRYSEFSENLSASDSRYPRRVFIISLIYRMFFLQRAVSRCWPTSCGVQQEVRSFIGLPIWQMEGNIDDED
jgi:hypothetical protein